MDMARNLQAGAILMGASAGVAGCMVSFVIYLLTGGR
jgi:hypothetical protein